MRVFIILPVHDEGACLPTLIPEIPGPRGFDKTIIVVDDGSLDNTIRTVKEFTLSSSEIPTRHTRELGLGKAIPSGFEFILHNMETIKSDLIVSLDADCAHDMNILPQLTEKAKNSDIVITSRYKGGAR